MRSRHFFVAGVRPTATTTARSWSRRSPTASRRRSRRSCTRRCARSGALIDESYPGIRPAFGYPACPDHLPKQRLFELLGADEIGCALTESCMVTPGASVSGIDLGHPSARYFTVGRIDRDQVESYAKRSGIGMSTAEKWLGPNLAYDPGS